MCISSSAFSPTPRLMYLIAYSASLFDCLIDFPKGHVQTQIPDLHPHICLKKKNKKTRSLPAAFLFSVGGNFMLLIPEAKNFGVIPNPVLLSYPPSSHLVHHAHQQVSHCTFKIRPESAALRLVPAATLFLTLLLHSLQTGLPGSPAYYIPS